jgi:hypothetical protein
MDEVKLTIRLSTEDRRALKLHAVAQGRSIQDLLTELIHTELAKNATPPEKTSREEFVASLYARRGIDPSNPVATGPDATGHPGGISGRRLG